MWYSEGMSGTSLQNSCSLAMLFWVSQNEKKGQDSWRYVILSKCWAFIFLM